MLPDVDQSQEQEQQQQLSLDEISSPINTQLFEFCDSELLQEILQSSEVNSGSNCSSYTTHITVPPDIDKINIYQTTETTTTTNNAGTSTTVAQPPPQVTTTTATNNNTTANNNNNNMTLLFDNSQETELVNEISASIDFSTSPEFPVPNLLQNQQDHHHQHQTQHQPFDFNLVLDGYSSVVPPMVGPSLLQTSSVAFEEDCLSSVPSYAPLNPSSPSCSFLGPYLSSGGSGGIMNTNLDTCGIGNMILGGSDQLPTQELDFQADNGGIFCQDSMQHVFNPGELQALSSESQQLVGGIHAPSSLASEISSLDDSTFNKVGKLSVEQRKEKIHRYMKKRNERNFSKKIKYACRKTLADSRPRVRGRFAKNDDFGEMHRQNSSNQEEDDDEEVVVKEENEMVDSSDIFAHISGVNSFKCNFPIQSWT